ncbi:MAG: sensory transduction histidine kinase [Holophagaceae bacterium]|nr:sensory transduction histidine kinase [Holophagaceae bacterium]
MTPHDGPLSKEDYAQIVEQAPILIWRAGTDTLCNYFNQRWLDFTGRTLKQEQGNGWTEGVHPDDFQHCLDIFLSHFREQKVFEMEYRLRRYDGAWRWIFDRGVPVFDANGSFAGYIGSCIDVTERVEAQRALAEAQEAQIHTLRGLLPICMVCKKIRNDGGYWEVLENYIREHSEANFSHGICPDCLPDYHARMVAEAKANKRG